MKHIRCIQVPKNSDFQTFNEIGHVVLIVPAASYNFRISQGLDWH